MSEKPPPEIDAAGAGTESALSPEQSRHVRFVLELVDQLAARHGFDPAALTSPRTGKSLGPVLERMRRAVNDSNGESAGSNGT